MEGEEEVGWEERGYGRAEDALNGLGGRLDTRIIRWTLALDHPSYFELAEDGKGKRERCL